MKKWLIILIVVLATAGIVGSGTYYFVHAKAIADKNNLQAQIDDLNSKLTNANTNSVSAATNSNANVNTNAADQTDGWKTYTNNDLKISFKYPDTWQEIVLAKSTPTSGGSTGSIYSVVNGTNSIGADPDKNIYLDLYSSDYRIGPVFSAYSKPVNLSFTKDQFDSAVNNYGKSLGYEKIGNKGILSLYYGNPECSPFMSMKVYIPTKNPTYPNLIITVSSGFENDNSIKTYEQQQQAAGKDACDQETVYQGIADKVMAGTYSAKVLEQKQIIEQIAQSFRDL